MSVPNPISDGNVTISPPPMNTMLTALAAHRGFVVYRLAPLPNGKTDKIPVNPFTERNSDAQDQSTWLLPEQATALAASLGPGHGVGIVIYGGSTLFCVDIDGCIDEAGNLSEIAQATIARFPGAVVEVSQSGKGLHIFGVYRGVLAPHAKKNTAWSLELYTEKRFIALTGNWLPGHEAGHVGTDCTEALTAFAAEYFPAKGGSYTGEWTDAPAAGWDFITDDDELLAWASTYHDSKTAFGAKAPIPLLMGADESLGKWFPPDASSSEPYDASSADQAMANFWAWATGNNCERTERLMRRTKLARAKWDTRDDYLPGTIAKACADAKKWPTKRSVAALVPAGTAAGAVGTEIEPIPQARHLATDQRNVDRIIAAYGTRLLSVGGKLYAWSGTHWKPDDGLARRFAGNLSRIVAEERERAKAQLKEMTKHPEIPQGEQFAMLEGVVDALEKWGPKCEMRATQNAALNMLIEAVKIDADKLDSDKLLINLENGTYNVATGELQPHNPLDYITKVAPVMFDPAATCPRFDKFLMEIFDNDTNLVGFVLRWFGYCATGATKEQFVVIHWGGGSNGKGTLIWQCVSPILGDYAGAGAPGLLTAKNEDQRHPAEIADLFGKRMVTCSESDEGATLREGFVKQASGEDKMKGRFLHGQFFEFRPTHKLQLMTNKKPVVKGTDHGIWRRLLLLPYLVQFGTPEEIKARKASQLKDTNLEAALKAEWPGILNRIIEGARQWHSVGLQPPKKVLDASEAYRHEQDRVGEFVRDELTLDPDARTEGTALYAHYTGWNSTTRGGEKPMTQKGFIGELETLVPGFARVKSNGKRCIAGVRIGQPAFVPPPSPG
jgi:putative DNA primase/helicase